MNNKILIGSIIAVAILVLMSFTGVVGYQTTKSSTISRASPLFTVRSSRAIDEESKDFTCDYVGREEENILSFPKRDSRTVALQQVIEIISKMDDVTFNRFLDLIIKHLHKRDDFQEYTKEEIILSLNQLRNNPSEITQYILEGEESNLHTQEPYECTIFFNCDFTIKYDIKYCIEFFLSLLVTCLKILVILPFYIIIEFGLDLMITFLYNCLTPAQ